MEVAFSGIPVNDLHHIGHGHRPPFISCGVFKIENLIEFFQREAVYFSLEHLIIEAAVNLRAALKFRQALIIHKGDIVGVTLHIDLINSYIQRS